MKNIKMHVERGINGKKKTILPNLKVGASSP